MIEQKELTWYLSDGISIFERSTCGAILDKLELESCTSQPCKKCGGGGIVNEPFKCKDPKDPAREITILLGAWCSKCKGIGVEPVFLNKAEQELAHSGDWSENSDRDGARGSVPDETLVRFAHVSRLLTAVPPDVRAVIELAYGDEGEELSHGLKGRHWAVMPLTEAGKELLSQERDRKTTVGVVAPEKPVQCLVSLADLPKNEKHPERTILLAQAVEQAEKLLKSAEAVWELVVGGLTESELIQ